MRLAAIAWRGLQARPVRTALTVAGIAMGVALLVAALVSNQAATEAVQRAADEVFGRASLRVRAFDEGGLTPRGLTNLGRTAGVVAVAPVAERQITVNTAPGPKEAVFSLLALGVDPSTERRVRSYELVAGSFLDPSRATDVLVNAAWAAEHDLRLGDELQLTGADPGRPPLRISGMMDEAGFGTLAQGAIAVMDRATLDAAFLAPAPIRYADLVVGAGRQAEVERALPSALSEPFVVQTRADLAQQLGRAQGSFAGMAFGFGLVALLVGSFLVANTLAMTVGERTREIGLLRAAGATSRQVLGLFVRQALALGLVGSALGVLIGLALAATVVGFLRGTRAVLIEGLPLNPAALALGFGVGVLVTLVAAAVPSVQAARLAPVEALRPFQRPARALGSRISWLIVLELAVVVLVAVLYPLGRGNAGIGPALLAPLVLLAGAGMAAYALEPLSRIIGRPFEWFFGARGLLGRANLGRNRVRSGLTVGALMVGLASVITLGSVAATARATADRWVDSILPGGNAIQLGLPVDQQQFQPTFDAIAGVRSASPIAQFAAVRSESGGRVSEVSMAGIDPSVFQDAGSLIFSAGNRARAFEALRDGGAVLVPEAIAGRDGLAVGSTLDLALPGRQSVAFTVAGVVAYSLPGRSSDGAVLISLADARQHFDVSTAALWVVERQPDVAPVAFEDAVAGTAHQLAGEPVTAHQLADDLSRSLDRLVGLFDVLALVSVVIGALGIVNTLSMGVLERVREIAILRAHGMTSDEVQAMVVAEAAIMGLVAGVLAAAVGVLAAWALIAAAGPGVGAGVVVPWPLLISVVLLGTAIAVIASIYPARVAASRPMLPGFTRYE